MIAKLFSKKHLLIFFLLLVLAVVFWLSSSLQEALYGSLGAIESYTIQHPVLGMVLFIILTIFSAMFVFFSTVALVPISVFVWGEVTTFVLLLVSWVIGGIFSYFIGKYWGLRIVSHFVPVDRIEYYGKRINAKTGFSRMFLFRLLAPSEIPGYLLGLIRYKFTRYLFITFLAELPFAWGAVYASEIFLQRKFMWFAVFIVFVAAIIAAMKYYFNKEIRTKSNVE